MNTPFSRPWLAMLRVFFIIAFALGAAGGAHPTVAQTTSFDYSITDADGSGFDDTWEFNLAQKFAPKVYLHSCENNFPSSIEWYLARTRLRFHHAVLKDHGYSDPVVTNANLLGASHDGDSSDAMDRGWNFGVNDFFLEVKDSAYYAGDRTNDGKWPSYVHVMPAPNTGHTGMIDIQYWFFYPYNGNLSDSECGGRAGEHEGDWEHVTVRVNPEGTQVHSVYLSAHGDGSWASYGSYTVVAGTQQPVVYAAYHSHANYFTIGTQHRGLLDMGGFIPNDYTNANGIVWDTAPYLKLIGNRDYTPRSAMEWIRYVGHWGEFDCCDPSHPDGPSGPASKGNWTGGDTWSGDTSLGAPTISGLTTSKRAYPGQAFTFNLGSFTDSSSAGPWTVTVNWGDGWYTQINNAPQNIALTAPHTYAANLGGRSLSGFVKVSNGVTAATSRFTTQVGTLYPPAPDPDLEGPEVTIVPAPDSPDGANGWYKSPVTLDVQTYDASGVFAVRCALDPEIPPATYADLPEGCMFVGGAPVTVQGNHTLYAAAVDIFDNVSTPVSFDFKIDSTAPVIDCFGGPFLLGSGNQVVEAVEVDAAVSGLNEAAGTLSGTISTDTIGPKTFTFTAFDLAGNEGSQTCSFDVIYHFAGFFPPVEVAPAVNRVKAGSAIPVKFSLAGDQGMGIFAAGSPASQPVACDTLLPTGGPAAAADPPGKSGLSFSQGGQYGYVWKTDNAWAGACRMLTVDLIDGTQHTAYFMFK